MELSEPFRSAPMSDWPALMRDPLVSHYAKEGAMVHLRASSKSTRTENRSRAATTSSKLSGRGRNSAEGKEFTHSTSTPRQIACSTIHLFPKMVSLLRQLFSLVALVLARLRSASRSIRAATSFLMPPIYSLASARASSTHFQTGPKNH